MIKTHFQAKITQLSPSEEGDEGVVYRLLEYEDEDDFTGQKYPMWELYEARYEPYDDGDAESGPHLSWNMGDWHLLAQGMGHIKSLEEAVASVKEYPPPRG